LSEDPDAGVRLELAMHLEELEANGAADAPEIRQRLREDTSGRVRRRADGDPVS
jgi:hypothetical protein